jgi:hypothetical protein
MFRVVKLFTDLQDDNHKYEVGDEYPRLGFKPSLARIKELCGTDNRRGRAVIEEVEEIPFGDNAVTSEDLAEEPTATPKKKGGRKPKKED